MQHSVFSLVATSLVSLALVSTSAPAASVLWATPTNIINDVTQVRTDGTLSGAWAWTGAGTGTVTPVTVNGVTFQRSSVANSNTAGSQGNLAWSASRGFNNNTAAAPYSSLSAEYKGILGGYLYSANGGPGATPQTNLTFTNLVGGQTYLLQVWSEMSLYAYGPASTLSIVGATGGSVVISPNTTAAVGGLGQFVTAQITMGASEQSFVLNVYGAGQSTISAIQLRAVPEPGTIALAGLGLGAILLFRRRRSAR